MYIGKRMPKYTSFLVIPALFDPQSFFLPLFTICFRKFVIYLAESRASRFKDVLSGNQSENRHRDLWIF